MIKKLKKAFKHPGLILVYLKKFHVYDWIPDAIFLKFIYRNIFGRKLDLNEPRSFNEKLQWLKLYDRKPEYTAMVDKYLAKELIAEKLGKEYVIPTIGVWDRFEDIAFDKLPDRFVLKCNHDSGGLVICRDKAKLDIKEAEKKIKWSLNRNYYWVGREWPYKDVKRKIIAEEYIENEEGKGLVDYKFYCFNGHVEYLYVSEGLEDHKTARISFLTPDWEFAPFERADYKPFSELPKKPGRFSDMLKIAEKLSEGFPFLRVDLYEVNGEIYFSEFTFAPCSGWMPFVPDEWDYKLGELIVLPQKQG